ncbi:MAG: hypothetical protein ABL907_08145 [Hyphomicrobium sp.]
MNDGKDRKMDGTLAERMERLEQDVDRIKSEIASKPARKDWRSWCGTAKDDPGFDEMIRLGKEYRQSQREEYDGEPGARS